MAEAERPSIVILRSHIGYPSPKYTDTAYAHGNALGADEVAATKAILGLPHDDFYVPDDVLAYYREAGARGRARRGASGSVAEPRSASASRASARSYDACLEQRGLPGWEAKLPTWDAGRGDRHARGASGKVLEAIVDVVPGARRRWRRPEREHRHAARRRAASISTHLFGGRQLHFGVREHGMGSIMNGMSVSGAAPRRRHVLRVQRLHASRGAPRRARRSTRPRSCGRTTRSASARTVPTHQPIEHLASLRAMPEPARHPARRRQRVRAGVAVPHRRRRPHRDRARPPERAGARGHRRARRRRACRGARTCSSTRPTAISTSCSSAPAPRCRSASTRRDALAADGRSVRVVSFPSLGAVRRRRTTTTASRCCPPGVPTLAVEAGASFGWERYADDVVAIDHFGASAPGANGS